MEERQQGLARSSEQTTLRPSEAVSRLAAQVAEGERIDRFKDGLWDLQGREDVFSALPGMLAQLVGVEEVTIVFDGGSQIVSSNIHLDKEGFLPALGLSYEEAVRQENPIFRLGRRIERLLLFNGRVQTLEPVGFFAFRANGTESSDAFDTTLIGRAMAWLGERLPVIFWNRFASRAVDPKWLESAALAGDWRVFTQEGVVGRFGVAFLDVCGSTEFLNLHRDRPEIVGRAIQAYLELCARFLGEREGVIVDKFVGDGLVAFFTPTGEAHVARSVRILLELQEQLAELSVQRSAGGEEVLTMRGGLHWGDEEVYLGAFGSAERANLTAVGFPVSLAARIQGVALPGGISLTQEVVNACEREGSPLQVKDLGIHNLKGAGELPVYQAIGFC